MQTMPNLNKIPVEQYGDLFENIIPLIIFDKHNFNGVGRKWNEELLDLIQREFSSEGARRVLTLENKRQAQLEKVLDPLDNALNLSFDDWRNHLERFNLEYTEVLCRNPHYAAAFKICPKNRFGYPDFETSDETSGHIWKEEKYQTFIARLQSHDFSEELEFLGIKEEATELLLIELSLNRSVKELNLQKSLDALRDLREKFSNLIKLLLMDLFTADQRYKKSITVTAEEMIAHELDQEQYQKDLQEFSLNDLPYSQFFNYICLFNDDTVPEALREYWEKIFKPNMQTYKKMYEPYPSMEMWNELEQSESTLFRAVERLFVDLGFLCHSRATDYSKEYEKKFYASKRHRYCSELFDELIELEVGADGMRGVTLNEGDLPKIITCFSKPEQLEKLEYLGIKESFLEIVKADLRSRELWDESASNTSLVPLDDLRTARWRACEGISMLTCDIFKDEK